MNLQRRWELALARQTVDVSDFTPLEVAWEGAAAAPEPQRVDRSQDPGQCWPCDEWRAEKGLHG